MRRIIELLEPISTIFSAILNFILHPIETITGLIDIALAFVPAVCVVIFLFYIITGSRKILTSLSFCLLVFILLKTAIVFDMVWLVIVVAVAVIIIRLIGVIA